MDLPVIGWIIDFIYQNWFTIIMGLIVLIIIVIFAKIFFEYLNPYEVGLREKSGKLESKMYHGGVVFSLPLVHRVRRIDIRHKVMWCAFWGERGSRTHIRKVHEEFHDKMRLLSRIHTSIDFDENDLQSFGPLITSDGVILNAVVGIFYRIEDPFKLVTTIGEDSYKPALAAKLASSLRAVVATMTLNEMFEKRSLLVEKTRKATDDVAAQWGIDVVSVTLEELFLEDMSLQDSLDQKRVEELRGEVKIMVATMNKEKTRIERSSQREIELIKLKGEEEVKKIKADAMKKIAEIEVEKQKLLADLAKYEAEAEAEIKKARAKAEAEIMKAEEKLVTPELVKYESLLRLQNTVKRLKDKIVILPTEGGGTNAAIILPYLLSRNSPGQGIILNDGSKKQKNEENKEVRK